MLDTAPSLSVYAKTPAEGEEEEEEREIKGLGDQDGSLVRSVTIGDKIDGAVLGSGDFSFRRPNMDLIDEEEGGEGGGGDAELGDVILGMEKLGTVDFRVERESNEEYYMELLEEYPNHPLVLRNYANLLQSKRDLQGAEYYYFRATQADPGDGEILSRYAQVLWELYHDREKALTYFERSVQTAPDDSNVLASYAKFLWDVDEDRDEESTHPNQFEEKGVQNFINSASLPTQMIEAGDANDVADVENYCKRMLEENPSDPYFLKAYAQFLYQSKGDLQGAKEYYSQAILTDPQDGNVLSQYAKLVWELYHDEDRAASYFEKAIQDSPGDSDVLAAYASFLWALDDDEVEMEV